MALGCWHASCLVTSFASPLAPRKRAPGRAHSDESRYRDDSWDVHSARDLLAAVRALKDVQVAQTRPLARAADFLTAFCPQAGGLTPTSASLRPVSCSGIIEALAAAWTRFLRDAFMLCEGVPRRS